MDVLCLGSSTFSFLLEQRRRRKGGFNCATLLDCCFSEQTLTYINYNDQTYFGFIVYLAFAHTVCAIQFATKGIRYFGSLNTSRDSSNMLTTFSGHHSKVPDHLIQHCVHNEVIIAESLQNICIQKSTAHPF